MNELSPVIFQGIEPPDRYRHHKFNREIVQQIKALKTDNWHGPLYILKDYAVIASLMWLVLGVSWWFYPLALIMIGAHQRGISTILHDAAHAGFRTDTTTQATTVPIYLSNAYAFHSVEHAADVFDLRDDGRTYSRLMNPTTDVFEQRIAAIEGGVSAVATSSGQAAITLSILNIARAGDNIVSSTDLYGGTINLLSKTFERLGIETRFVDPSDPEKFASNTDERTRCWFAEALPNPKLRPIPLARIGDRARDIGIPLIIDNTMTPMIARPFDLGANIVLHSTSKYICGHGTTIGGVVIDGGNFDWQRHGARLPAMVEPDESHGNVEWLKAAASLEGHYAASPYLLKMRNTLMRDFGPCPSPMSSFLLLQGVETLGLRIERHCENARKVAGFLADHDLIESVTYPSLASDHDRSLANDLMGDRGGPLVVFDLSGGLKAGKRFIENLKMIYHVSNIGDARTLATHPASTTHASIPRDARINSLHVQGVAELSHALSVDAHAADGVIEAVSVKTARSFAAGVQWHPEWQHSKDEISQSIFQAFGNACAQRKKEREAVS